MACFFSSGYDHVVPPIGDSQFGDLLRSGGKVWNAKKPPGWVNLADLDFDDLDLRSAYLSNAGMWDCNLRGSDLSDAILDEADLSCTTLCRAKLIGTSVQGTNFGQRFTTDRLKQIASDCKNQALDGPDGL